MNKYKIIASYETDIISYTKNNDLMIVTVPLLHNNLLNFGLQRIKDKLKKLNINSTELGFDVFSLATMVYLTDTRISRVIHGQDSWSREIAIELPVSNAQIWNSQQDIINKMLSFLTGDIWEISFNERNWKYNQSIISESNSTDYNKVTLFSGGMDSLISTINLMEERENTLLISHANEGLTKKSQTYIISKLNELYPSIIHDQLDLWMSFPDGYLPEGQNDSNTRSRSFLFISLGILALTGLENINELLVPENGLIALNVPLDVTRVGSYSTRTTHPYYINLWNELLLGLGINKKVVNPYWNKTKGEMASECLNKDILYKTMYYSFSCSSPNKARWKHLSARHCGYCVPCLIRRAAMNAAFNEDNTVYTINNISDLLNSSSESESVQIKSFVYAIDKIKKNPGIEKLYIHKPGPLPNIDDYLSELANTYYRGLMEVDQYIRKSIKKENNNDI